MTTEKVKVRSCSVKKTGNKNGRDWTVYNVELADGRVGDSFDEMKVGEDIEIIVEHNGQYGLAFKKVKPANSVRRINNQVALNSSELNRGTALRCACEVVKFIDKKEITSDQVLKTADKFYSWLSQKEEAKSD